MNQIELLLDQLRDTDEAADMLAQLMRNDRFDEANKVNANALHKRRADLERRLSAELRITQSDLVQYHVQRTEVDRYPAAVVAKAIIGFQEIVTAIFDAIRSVPKQRYRPSPDNVQLSTLNLATAFPARSILVSMSVENERLLAVKSELDQTFERVFQILTTRDSNGLRALAEQVGIAPISKAHDWAEITAEYGLNTKIYVRKEIEAPPLELQVSKAEALSLKEAIEQKSEQTFEPHEFVGELVGIDIERPNTYFHLKTTDDVDLQGKLADSFVTNNEWAVRVIYTAQVLRVTTVKYATGEEKVEWLLTSLSPVGPHRAAMMM
jgi:hypothetical protein